MFKKWKKGHHHDPQREKIKDELFEFKKTAEHGFPNQPSALAFDRKLKLMAIGLKNGSIKIYGAPGVEFTGLHDDTNQVVQLHFLTGEARLVSILDNNTMHLWELQNIKDDKKGAQELVEVGAYQLSGRPGINQITEVMIKSTNDVMWVGTEGGGIYPLSLPDFKPRDGGIIHQDQVMQSIPESYKTGKALGPVEAIEEHPQNPTLVLIGYSRGLVVLWNDQTQNVEKYFLGNQQLEAVSWNSNGREFMTAHNDGSLLTWQINNNDVVPSPNIPYGPFPCKAITKIMWKTSKTQPFVVFSGGMPRANYGDRHCVSVICGRDHVTFDITSRIIDFFLVCENSSREEDENPEYLIILAEEELIAIDLTKEGWPTMTPPYLASLHSSAITCSTHISGMSSQTWKKIEGAAKRANAVDGKNKKKQHVALDSYWPVDGGFNLETKVTDFVDRDIILTGHEDGTIKFWDATSVSMTPIMKLYTAYLFVTDGDNIDHDAFEDEYPPFRKVGEFDPYSDDPKLGIRKLAMCGQTGTIVAGGTAGQVFVFVLSDDAIESALVTKEVDILNERSGFTWKGHEKLTPKDIHLSMDPGYQVNNVVQAKPPASITAINVQAQWGLVGFGTSHGYVLFDYQQNKCVLSRCTLETGDNSAMEGHFSRAKSFKMSLRQSIRRLRGSFKGRGGSKRRASGRRRNYRRGDMSKKLQEANAALVDEEETPSGTWSPAGQRKVEARSSDEGMTGMIRCIYFASTYIRDTVSLSPTFWAGTNTGSVYVYGLDIPDYSKRQELEVTSLLGKEIQLMHRAPVIDVTVVDSHGSPVHLMSHGKASNGTAQGAAAHHFLVISSEEQFKVFTLPKISARKKLKLTAVDGSLVRKVTHARFDSDSNPDYHEYALVCLTNQGEILVMSAVPSFRPQVHYSCIGADDPHGISSAILTSSGQGFYLLSSSEYERFTLSKCNSVESYCRVQLDPSTPIAPIAPSRLVTAQVESPENHAEKAKETSISKTPEKKNKTPTKEPKREGSVVVAMKSSSPKQPLLCDESEEDEGDDTDHVAKHESVLEEAERTLAELDITGQTAGSEDTEVNVQELLGAVAEAEKNLEKK
ncbi:lethal(2) giant larvae protein homolog 1-like isoform X1 [Styela clava]